MKYIAVLCGVLVSAVSAQASITSPVDKVVMVTFDGDASSVGSVSHGLTGTVDFAVRERTETSQTNRRIYEKLNVLNAAAAVSKAHRLGLLD